jgi:RND family efflux transporter MFP subunit
VNTKKPLKRLFTAPMVLLAVLCLGCGKGGEPEPSGRSLKTVKAAVGVVKTISESASSDVMGTVSPRQSAVLSAQVMGEIRKIMVREGDTVKKGDLLVQIEDRQISAHYRQAMAGLNEAAQGEQAAIAGLNASQASADLAEATYKRFKALLDAQSVSRQEFEEVEARFKQAKAGFLQAQSMRTASRERTLQAREALAAAESVLKDAAILSPYNGKVAERLVDPGDLAAPGTPLVKIEETGNPEVHFAVPESRIQNIRLKDRLSVILPSREEAPVSGEVIAMDPSADPATRSFRVKISLPEISGLKSGMFVRVMIPSRNTAVILVPKTAVFNHGQLTAVFLVDGGNIARFRLIRSGRIIGDQVEVVSGLGEGDRYVIQPDHNVFDGVKVEGA